MQPCNLPPPRARALRLLPPSIPDRYRSQVAFDNIFSFAVPFLEAAKQKGLLLVSVTDGNGDVTQSEVLDKLFDVNVSVNATMPSGPCWGTSSVSSAFACPLAI